ncbi:serine/threonine protein kinase [Microbispora rosea]|uniref:non-specific serine/threonine protein kinase n=1 Tax=Microbispora rosea TaxID=58117 RepID=A0A1N6R8D1_9ACTN|nr:Stk1 family PASTA domain-containing Ser/Thr kinase [Microbispora rosea]GIH45706.1 serine/threonine protein kinase [Microbispora rosea subsp. rosea]SIQ25083.1 serine/threonine protein kinase [Microbispora rosea]
MDTTLTDPLVGQLLDGRYRVESRIARGGMASVYLALDVRLDRTVAVKVMHRSLAEDPHFVRRFIGEAKSVASLSHPNIVQVFDQGTDGAHVYLSMEYVPGRTLRDVLRRRGRLPAREALEMVIPVLAALGAAHQAGLIHRDVKPENVLLADDGRVKVVDFGLARAIEATNQTKTGMMIGTIGYMSPEQVTTGMADARSDVYAAGIMLFELLTGRQPYTGETPMSVAYRHVHETVPPPSSIVPDAPPVIDALVAAATDKDPAGRPADATAMLVAAVEIHRTLPKTGNTGAHAARHGAPDTGAHSGVRTGAHRTIPPAGGSSPFGTGSLGTGSLGTGSLGTGSFGTGQHALAEPDSPLGHTMIQPRSELLTGRAETGRRRGRGRIRPVWFVAALAVVMLAGIAFTGWWFSQGRYTKVPDLVNKPVTVARQVAQQAGFEVRVGEARFDDKVPKDIVLDTDPGAGAEVVKGSVLTLIPSAGPQLITVPIVEKLSLTDARAKIADAGLTPGRVSKSASDTIPRDQVIRTNPPVGKRVKKGSTVNFVVSAGLLMPDVTQMMRDQAEKFLREKGFNVQIDETTDDAPPGTVIAQDPPGGAEVVAGATVHLTASRGPDQGFHWPWEVNPADPGQSPPAVVNVPDVRFKAIKDAVNELKAAGFNVKTRRLVGTDRVVGENPLGQQPPGTTITIWH